MKRSFVLAALASVALFGVSARHHHHHSERAGYSKHVAALKEIDHWYVSGSAMGLAVLAAVCAYYHETITKLWADTCANEKSRRNVLVKDESMEKQLSSAEGSPVVYMDKLRWSYLSIGMLTYATIGAVLQTAFEWGKGDDVLAAIAMNAAAIFVSLLVVVEQVLTNDANYSALPTVLSCLSSITATFGFWKYRTEQREVIFDRIDVMIYAPCLVAYVITAIVSGMKADNIFDNENSKVGPMTQAMAKDLENKFEKKNGLVVEAVAADGEKIADIISGKPPAGGVDNGGFQGDE
eukprot:750690_1